MLSDRKTKGLLESAHLELFLQIYLLGRKIRSLVKTQNSDCLVDMVLLVILKDKNLPISKLGEMLSIKPSATSEKIGQLESLGLVKRVSSKDGREKMIGITKKGLMQLERVLMEVHQKWNNHVCPMKMKRNEINTALNLLKKMTI